MTGAEEWRVVDGFPDYAVSSAGRVKRIVDGRSSKAGRILRQQSLHGYCYVYLSKSGRVSACRVHRLVCAAFNGAAPTPKHHAAHNDGVRDNNKFDNLRWATSSENMQDKNAHGTMASGLRNGAHTKPDRLARGARNGRHTKRGSYRVGERHHSSRVTAADVLAIREDARPHRVIASVYSVSKCAITNIKLRKTWRHVP